MTQSSHTKVDEAQPNTRQLGNIFCLKYYFVCFVKFSSYESIICIWRNVDQVFVCCLQVLATADPFMVLDLSWTTTHCLWPTVEAMVLTTNTTCSLPMDINHNSNNMVVTSLNSMEDTSNSPSNNTVEAIQATMLTLILTGWTTLSAALEVCNFYYLLFCPCFLVLCFIFENFCV